MDKKTLKIAFVGTSSVGKTTLLNKCREVLAKNYDLLFVREAARDFFLRNKHITDRFSVYPQRKIQALALKREKRAHALAPQIIVCDRSVLDAVVYTRVHGDADGSKELFEKVANWLRTYDKIFLLDPNDLEHKIDYVRTEDASWRQRFHEGFISFFKDEDVPYELLSGDLEKRVNRVEQYIKEAT